MKFFPPNGPWFSPFSPGQRLQGGDPSRYAAGSHVCDTDGLIGSYQGAIGIKTGYTDAAGHCLLFEAVRNRRALIGVVLGSPATGPAAAAQGAEKMLNWGFGLR